MRVAFPGSSNDGKGAPDRNECGRAVDETETLTGRLLLTIEKRKFS
ncbi:hypothetical protein N182_06775 [Sinorhizobium sp. GL2]|nr:hypothetical protein N182_06775 [Sinorhizobium sp. GL2]